MKLNVKIAGIFAVVAFALTAVAADAAFTRDLTLGSTGADVTELQTVLESKGYLTIPAGTSKGYFGALTKAAVIKWQAAVGLPSTGYFGPMSRAKIAETGTTTGGSTTDDSSTLGSGEASLEAFDLSSGDDSEIEEGDTAEIAEIEFDVEDGDIALDRVDLMLSNASSSDPWDVFEEVRLLVDGDEIGSADLSDEDEYLDEDDGTVRISDIDFEAMDGDTVTIVVELTAQNNVDEDDMEDWTLKVLDDGIRATDGEGIQQYVGSDSESVSFDVEVVGADDELKVSSSSDDDDIETTLEVKDDAKSDELDIFAFDIEAEESDIEFDTVQFVVETGSADVQDVVADFVLDIDGEEFDDWSFVSGASATSSVIEFDIDGDYTLDADSEVVAVLKAEFKAANGVNYSTGETIQASIVAGAIEAEGGDDLESEGTATGDERTLSTEGLMVSLSSKDAESTGTDDKVGEFTFVVDVTAFEEAAFVELAATRGTATDNTGFNITILDGNNGVVSTGTTTFSIEADEDEESSGRVEIGEDDTVQFTVTVFFDAATAGSYKAQLHSVNFNDTDADEDTQHVVTPASTYRTASTYVEN